MDDNLLFFLCLLAALKKYIYGIDVIVQYEYDGSADGNNYYMHSNKKSRPARNLRLGVPAYTCRFLYPGTRTRFARFESFGVFYVLKNFLFFFNRRLRLNARARRPGLNHQRRSYVNINLSRYNQTDFFSYEHAFGKIREENHTKNRRRTATMMFKTYSTTCT